MEQVEQVEEVDEVEEVDVVEEVEEVLNEGGTHRLEAGGVAPCLEPAWADLEVLRHVVGVKHHVDVGGVDQLVGELPRLQGEQVVQAPLGAEPHLGVRVRVRVRMSASRAATRELDFTPFYPIF